MDLNLKGRTALITASSRGIGYSCAETLSKEGANVVICARESAALNAAADRIRNETGGLVLVQQADVTVLSDIQQLNAAGCAAFGGIDILVAIGGSPPRGSFAQIDETQLHQAFAMTVLPLFWLIKTVIPHMQAKKWGRIVAVQSRSVKEPIPSLTASNATRPGAAGLLKDLSQEVARDGILLNTVLPGRILTARFKQGSGFSDQPYQSYLDKQASELPIGRLGTAQEVADAVAFLASDRASYINGVSLAVDGGLIRSI